ncbi:ferredoxin, partial [Thiolapillus sp.]
MDGKNRLIRIFCSREIVKSGEERLQFWHQLKGIAGELNPVDVDALIEQTKVEMANRLSSTLLSLTASGSIDALSGAVSASGNSAISPAAPAATASPDYEPAWIETPECTACDECTEIAPGIFGYNADKQAEVINPQGGKYKDIVRAAEKCTAGCLHPGTPWDMSERDIDKLIKRAEKYRKRPRIDTCSLITTCHRLSPASPQHRRIPWHRPTPLTAPLS